MSQHLRVYVDGDGGLESQSRGDVEAWFSLLPPTAVSSTRIVLAAHGGLVSRTQGEKFADSVQAILPGGWSVAFITQTGFLETVWQHYAAFLDHAFLDPLRQLANLYRDAPPRYSFPELYPVDARSLPANAELVVLQPVLNGAGVRRSRKALPQKQLVAVRGSIPDLPTEQQQAADSLVNQIVSKLTQQGARTLPEEALKVMVRHAAQATARQLPRPENYQQELDDLLRPAQERKLAPQSFRRNMSFHEAVSGGGMGGSVLPDNSLNALDATLIENLIRGLGGPAGAWGLMKDKMEHLFQGDNIGAELLGRLSHLPHVRVSAIGHSLGGIFVDHLLRHVAQKGYMHLLDSAFYLAPANTISFHQRTQQAIQDFCAVSPIRFFCLSLHAKNDLNEPSDINPYPRSILYLISNALESTANTPLFGLEAYAHGLSMFKEYQMDWCPEGALNQQTHGGFIHNKAVRDWIAGQIP